jgi:hypothetical protein
MRLCYRIVSAKADSNCYLGVIEEGSRVLAEADFRSRCSLFAPVFFSISAGLPLLPMATTSV